MAQGLYFGGIPTDLDIKELRGRWPDDTLQVGQVIPYPEVEAVIGHDKSAARFKTVTARWRKLVEAESNYIIGTKKGVGFKVLSEPEKVDLGGSKLRSAFRATRRCLTVAARVSTKDLEPHELSRLEHQVNVASKMAVASKLNARRPEKPSLT